jgi:membrane protease YdiL (CAAX protease family)
MTDPSFELSKPSWTWRASLDVGFFTLFLSAFLSFLLNTIMEGVSSQLNLQIIGSPVGTSILAGSEALLLCPLLIYMRRFGINRVQLGIYVQSRRQVLTDVLIGLSVGLLMLPISFFVSALNELVLGPEPGAQYINKAFTATSPIEAILLCSSVAFVVAPVEEVVVRGFVQQGLERSHGKYKGLLLASIFFAIMHLSLWSIFPLTLLGIVIGMCFQLRNRRIIAPIVSHACYMVGLILLLSF